ncbi:hypothetical protein LCGC14_1411330 [marine sediment metagenome]|uniref:Uncharacterized protein n=1 Tax=marine sediment metagenome TaxID=412755 RepID=A0A0F9M9L5_9ZZZZ
MKNDTETENLLDRKDLRIDVYTQGLFGDCRVTITHMPSGTVRAYSGRGQMRTKSVAMGLLYKDLAAMEQPG